MVKRTEAEWARIAEEYRASGSSMASWCVEHGISAKTLGKHMKQFRDGVAKKKTRSLSEWEDLIKKQENSGLTRLNWCDKNGVNVSAMDSAQQRLERRTKKDLSVGWLSVDVDSGRTVVSIDTVYADEADAEASGSANFLPTAEADTDVGEAACVQHERHPVVCKTAFRVMADEGDGEEIIPDSDEAGTFSVRWNRLAKKHRRA